MTLKNSWPRPSLLLSAAVFLLAPVASWAQSNVLTVEAPARTVLKKTDAVDVKFKVTLKPGFHVNSNKPSDEYLIPLRLSFDGTPIESVSTQFPVPKMEKYVFSEKPLSVYSGEFEIVAKLKAKPDARQGINFGTAKLRYQACDSNSCLPPKTLEIKVPFEVF